MLIPRELAPHFVTFVRHGLGVNATLKDKPGHGGVLSKFVYSGSVMVVRLPADSDKAEVLEVFSSDKTKLEELERVWVTQFQKELKDHDKHDVDDGCGASGIG